MQQNEGNWGLITAGLGLIALGTIGPFALILMGILAMATKSGGLILLALGTGVLALWGLAILGLLGQFVCLLGPISNDTKLPLAISLGTVGVAQVVGNFAGILGFVSLIAFLAFLYGMCRELDSQDLKLKFNQAAGMGALALISCFLGTFSMMISPMFGLLGMLAAFVFGALGCARYAQTILDLVGRANNIRMGKARLAH